MVMEGKSKPYEVRSEERVEEIAARWREENGMKDDDLRLMAEGRMVSWEQLADLEDGATVQVLDEESEEPLGVGGRVWDEEWRKNNLKS